MRAEAAPAADRATYRIEVNEDPAIADRLERDAGWLRGDSEVPRRFRLAPGGHYVARGRDGDLLGACAVFPYPDAALAWIGGMIVLPHARRRGIARSLLLACLRHAESRGVGVIGLDATEAGRPLYESEGFHAVTRTVRWARPAGRVALPPTDDPRHAIYPLSTAEWKDLADYDAPRFGANRSAWLADVVATFPDRAFIAFDRATGAVAGYVLGQERFIGPLVADSPDAAASLTRATELAGTPPVVHVMEDNGTSREVFGRAGYEPTSAACTRMVRGPRLCGRPLACYAAAAWALG